MPTTPPPDERPEAGRADEAPAESVAPASAATTPPTPAAAEAPTVAGPPLGHRPPPPPPPGMAPYPFAPVVRMPLVNPQRRGTVAGIAAAAAVVALAVGFGVGYAAAPSHDGRDGHRMERGGYPGMMRGGVMGQLPRGQFPRGGYPGGQLPNGQLPNGQQGQPPASATPTAPSSSSSR